MSSPKSKKSRDATNMLLRAAEASNFRNQLSDHRNFTKEELFKHIEEHVNAIELMLDSSMAFSFSEEQTQKLLRGINNTSERLEQLRSLLSMKSTQNSSNLSPRKGRNRSTLKRK